jgi:hypothetical protein
LNLANHLNEGIVKALKFGKVLPEQIIIDSVLANSIQGFPKDAPAGFLEPAYSPNKKSTILINEKDVY